MKGELIGSMLRPKDEEESVRQWAEMLKAQRRDAQSRKHGAHVRYFHRIVRAGGIELGVFVAVVRKVVR